MLRVTTLCSRAVGSALVALSFVFFAVPAGATPCSTPDDCAIEEESTCGMTGECDDAGQCVIYPAGTVCVPARCDGDAFSFVPASACDGDGACVSGGDPQSCFQNNPCKLDLCGDRGCESVTKLDDTPCGDMEVCTSGVCGPSGGGGAGGGAGGGGASPTTAGAGGAGGGGAGGAGGSSEVDDADEASGCACRAAPPATKSGTAGLAVAIAGAAWARRRRAYRNARK